MAALELYGKCKELGHCDCGGFFGCQTPAGNNYAPNQPLVEMVECQVCDRGHLPSHPHIAKIDGDVPIDDAPDPKAETRVFGALPPDQQLPEWLRDKPGSQAIRPGTGTADQVDPTKLCQVCGEPWAPKHACKGAEPPETDFNRPKQRVTPYHMRKHAKCDVCGKKQQSNHKCKGRPDADAVKAPDECESCKRAGEPCVRHGGLWSDYDTPKGGEQIARQLPEPVPVAMPEPAAAGEPDRELAAIGTILKAVDGLGQKQLERVMNYVAARIWEAE
jgi:hypothetical protein